MEDGEKEGRKLNPETAVTGQKAFFKELYFSKTI